MLHHWFFYTIDFSAAILYISYHPSPKWKRNIPLTVYEVFQLFTAIQKSNREKKNLLQNLSVFLCIQICKPAGNSRVTTNTAESWKNRINIL